LQDGSGQHVGHGSGSPHNESHCGYSSQRRGFGYGFLADIGDERAGDKFIGWQFQITCSPDNRAYILAWHLCFELPKQFLENSAEMPAPDFSA
jgi:hypothetical protein